jgi:hypothetical protein
MAYGRYDSQIDLYPIPASGGIYTPNVGSYHPPHLSKLTLLVIYRNGANDYTNWRPKSYKTLPVISVAPVRCPRLN